MTRILAAGAALALTALAPLAPAFSNPVLSVDHALRVDHHAGPVDARYRGDVKIRQQQVGAVGPGGRPSTLRCTWAGDMTVAREARTASGAMMTRVVSRDAVVTGSHVGWCGSQRRAIAAQIAARRDALDRHLQAVAREDHQVLRAELDRFHGNVDVG
ncbi:hypothetical protein IFT82_07220 [Sphingomonas sp. CFBP 8760]|nr:hypothetical protein [Sphingomonas sp. CFBP 8760]